MTAEARDRLAEEDAAVSIATVRRHLRQMAQRISGSYISEGPALAHRALDDLAALVESLREELVRAERRQTVYLDLNAGMREALRDLYEWSKDYDAYTPAQNRAAAVLAGEGGPAAEEDG